MTSPVVLQAPLFGMLSWVNSSEVRRWLQTKIADPQTLRATSSGQDLFPSSLSRPNSDTQLTGAQDGMPGLPLPSHHLDHPWVGPHTPTALQNAASADQQLNMHAQGSCPMPCPCIAHPCMGMACEATVLLVEAVDEGAASVTACVLMLLGGNTARRAAQVVIGPWGCRCCRHT